MFANLKFEKVVRVSVLLIIILMMTIQLIVNRGFWLDEAMLAVNVRNLSYCELFLPLDMFQVAPIGFLLITKFFTTINDHNEFWYRFFVWIISASTIILIYKNHKIFNTFSLILFVSIGFVYYSSEFKQYALDSFFVVLLMINIDRNHIGRIFVILSLFLWFSSIAFVLIVPSIFTIVYLHFLGDKFLNLEWKNSNLKYKFLIVIRFFKTLNKKFLFFIFLIVSYYAAYYFLFYSSHPSTTFMRNYHSSNLGIFNPEKPFEYLINIIINFGYLFPFYHYFLKSPQLEFVIAFVIVAVCVILIVRSFKYGDSKSPLLIFVTISIFTSLLFSCLRLYPFGGRFSLFFVCFLSYVFTQYNEFSIKRRFYNFFLVLFLLFSLVPFFLMEHPENFPFRRSDNDKNLVIGLSNISTQKIYYLESSDESTPVHMIAKFYTPNINYILTNENDCNFKCISPNDVILSKNIIKSPYLKKLKRINGVYIYKNIK